MLVTPAAGWEQGGSGLLRFWKEVTASAQRQETFATVLSRLVWRSSAYEHTWFREGLCSSGTHNGWRTYDRTQAVGSRSRIPDDTESRGRTSSTSSPCQSPRLHCGG